MVVYSFFLAFVVAVAVVAVAAAVTVAVAVAVAMTTIRVHEKIAASIKLSQTMQKILYLLHKVHNLVATAMEQHQHQREKKGLPVKTHLPRQGNTMTAMMILQILCSRVDKRYHDMKEYVNCANVCILVLKLPFFFEQGVDNISGIACSSSAPTTARTLVLTNAAGLKYAKKVP